MKNALKFNLMAALLACLCLALAASAQAQTYYTNSATGNWSEAGSWTGTPPSVGGAADAYVSLTTQWMTATNDLAGAFTLNGINAAAATNSDVYAAGGSSLLFSGGTSVIINSGSAFSIHSPMTLANNLTIDSTYNAGTYLDGTISETAPSSITLNSATAHNGYTYFRGTNSSYSGGTIVNYGAIRPGADNCLGSGLLTWASTGIMSPDRSCTLTNDIQIGGGYAGVNLQIYPATNDVSPVTTLQLLGKIYNDTPDVGGSQLHHLNMFGYNSTAYWTAPVNIVVSNANYMGNLLVGNALRSLKVAGAFTNYGATTFNYANGRSTVDVLSNATLATIWNGASGAAFNNYVDVNVYGTMSLTGTRGSSTIYREGRLTVKPGGLFTNAGNINTYGTINIEAGGTLSTSASGWIPIFGTNGSYFGNVNVAGTFNSPNGVTLGAGGGYSGGLLNVYSNGVANIGTLEFNSNSVASVAGQLLCNGFQPFVLGGTLRLSDGTNAGYARFRSKGGTSVGILKIIGGAPGMSTLVLSNTSYINGTNLLFGGAGVNDNNLQLIKDNTGTLVLSNSANYYAGDTKVLGGILALGYPNLATNSTITVTNAVLELDFVATNTVKALFFNGTNTVPGVHNATTDPGILTGTGSLLALTGAGPSYSTTPTNITFSVTGSGGGTTLHLSWPASHLGWYVQSNSVAVNNTGAWYNVPNSQNGTSLSIPVEAGQANVYYRMRLP